ncbi:MAG: type I glutamate--ammonia ligase [Kiloniellales bacterium]|jgi:glutamine synthetase
MSDVQRVLSLIEEKNIQYVNFRFTDPRGKWQHLSHHVSTVDEGLMTDGVPFDGSSIAGWKDISESDMLLKPRAETAVVDPFSEGQDLIVICDIKEPATGETYGRDPRGVAKRAEMHMKNAGVGDTAYFGPEAEFFVFDSVRFAVTPNLCFYELDSEEGPYNSNKEYPDGNLAHRPRPKGGYFPVPPVDHGVAMRNDMVTTLRDMGVEVEKHHHEVAPSQHELGIRFNTLVRCADNMQTYKYVVHNVAQAWGKTATFMPKPVMHDNGSGMHVHQSIWKDGNPVFGGTEYADLSETALYYIGGIIKHGRALNAFTNASTNSFKRLVPGYEAPVFLAYAARNRSASCRIPHADTAGGKRVEVRFPDPTANPYLAFAAMLMAGLDGIENKIHPGDPLERNLYDMTEEEIAELPTVCRSLREACRELNRDRDFLKKGGVFTDDLIDGYLRLKREELHAAETTTTALEFEMYYSV